jgi:hypothetical protein
VPADEVQAELGSLESRTLDPEDKEAVPADEVQAKLAKFGMIFACYDSEECKGVISSDEHPFLICEYESLHRLIGKFDYIILDEFRSIAAIVASTSGERIAHHWDTLKGLCVLAQKGLCLDADMCVDSCAYKIQDMLMEHRIECRMRALSDHVHRLRKAKTSWDQREFGLLQQFRREAKEQRACDCSGGEHAVNGNCRIENAVHKMRKTLRLVDDGNMLLQLSKDAAAGKRIAVACGSVHEAESLKAFLRHYATGTLHWQD